MTERERYEGIDDDAESLLGAYVLDAVDDVERRRVERLLETSPEARAEVERLATAADEVAEAGADGATAPDRLFTSLMAQVAERASGPTATAGTAVPAPVEAVPVAPTATPTPTPGEVASLDRRRESRRSRVPWILSAAAVVVLFVVGAVVVGNRSDGGPTDSVAAMQQMAADAASMPGARTGALTDAGNTMAVQVVVDPAGHAFVMSGVLPALDPDHTYQLWSVDGGTPVSLGLLGSAPVMSVVGVDSNVHSLAITMEPVGGSAGPTTQAMASGTLQTA